MTPISATTMAGEMRVTSLGDHSRTFEGACVTRGCRDIIGAPVLNDPPDFCCGAGYSELIRKRTGKLVGGRQMKIRGRGYANEIGLIKQDDSRHLMASGNEALEACQKHGLPDVVLMDIRMPECDGFQALTLLRRHFPAVRVLMLAGVPLKHEIERAKALGACGYLSKSSDQNVILGAIRTVESGGTAFMKTGGHAAQHEHILSHREIEVLEHLARGLSREDIAAALYISAETVKSHVKSILAKLHAADRTEAVSRGYELGLLQA